MIDKFTIDKIHNAAQITDVVSDFVTLKKRGVNFVGLCPFHDDSTPSFYVSPSKNICKCFACGEGGTAVQFVMKHEQVSYYEALRYLAKKYFIEIIERELSDEERQTQSDRESMMVVNSWAQQYFTSRLSESEEGKTIGLSYFTERGFREDIIRKFQLGYGINKRDDLYQNAIKQGFNESYLVKTGLVFKRDDGTVIDRFHDRVIFPVHSLSGKVVAFGGRILGKKDKVAKYVNSPESEIYRKSYELYGIFFSKQAIVKADKCFLVEGYTDVISMYQTGVENVVSSSGTSLTTGQIKLIRRFTSNITLLYDGDTAGIQATIRGVDMLLEEGMNVKIVLLPEGEDPDSFARSHNSFDFMLFIKEHETDFIRFKSDLLLKEVGHDPIKRANMIKDIMGSVAIIPDNIIRSVYIKECSQLLDESEQVLLDEVIKIRNHKKSASQLQKAREQRDIQQEQLSKIVSEEKQITKIADYESVDKKNDRSNNEGDKIKMGDERLIVKKQYPYKKFESTLIRYVIRYGERPLFEQTESDNTMSLVKVAEYIQRELEKDEIAIQVPVYKQILDEAITHCNTDTFVATPYFLNHADLEISEIASNMISSRYQLSKFFTNKQDLSKQTELVTRQLVEKDEAQQLEKERKKIEQWIVQGIFELKNAYIKHEIDVINKQIKEFQSDEDKVMQLLKRQMELDAIKHLLSKELGFRVVTGVGK